MENKTIYINYFDEINDQKVRNLMGMCTQLMAQKPETLYFLFSSPGGMVNAGIVLYNFLKALPVKIVMHNMGAIDSIATVVFLAGEERYAAPHSSFLLHGVTLSSAQGISLTHSQLLEKLSGMREDEKRIGGIYQENTKLQEDEIKDLLKQGDTKDPIFAMEKGVISQICSPIIPKDAPLLSCGMAT